MRSFYSPLSISAPFYGHLKLLSYAERKEVETRMRDPGIELRTSCTKGSDLFVQHCCKRVAKVTVGSLTLIVLFMHTSYVSFFKV